jgi:XTP/dITP diphosphohydrolase
LREDSLSLSELLLATNNKGKVREYRMLLHDSPFVLTIPEEKGVEVAFVETGATLEENAALKAKVYAQASGLLTLADDSGLEVDALGGEPGVFSARYAGEGASDKERVDFLLKKLYGVPWEKRGARFRCVIAIATPDDKLELCQGECSGIIAFEPRGESGFGYDPIFYLPELGKMMAELTLEQKNKLSHRGKAAQKAKQVLEYLSKRDING